MENSFFFIRGDKYFDVKDAGEEKQLKQFCESNRGTLLLQLVFFWRVPGKLYPVAKVSAKVEIPFEERKWGFSFLTVFIFTNQYFRQPIKVSVAEKAGKEGRRVLLRAKQLVTGLQQLMDFT